MTVTTSVDVVVLPNLVHEEGLRQARALGIRFASPEYRQPSAQTSSVQLYKLRPYKAEVQRRQRNARPAM